MQTKRNWAVARMAALGAVLVSAAIASEALAQWQGSAVEFPAFAGYVEIGQTVAERDCATDAECEAAFSD